MFSVVCVCVSLSRGRSHVAIIHDALDLTVQDSPLYGILLCTDWRRVQTYSPEDPLLVTSSGQDWTPPQQVPTSGGWLLKPVWCTSRWYASYWDAFLF